MIVVRTPVGDCTCDGGPAPRDVITCGTCQRSWCDRCVPTPSARCPFEYEHAEEEKRPRRLRRPDIRRLTGVAYEWGAERDPDSYDRGYASGVEDLALLLTSADPAISERLVEILRAAGLQSAIPELYR